MSGLTYGILYRALTEAAARQNDVRVRSAETVALCEQRMAAEGLTRAELKKRAKREGVQ